MPLRRPPLITVFCILGFIFSAAWIPISFYGAIHGVPVPVPSNRLLRTHPGVHDTAPGTALHQAPWYNPVLAILGLVCWWGLWRMQRWALYLFIWCTLVSQVLMIALHEWAPASLVGLVVLALVAMPSNWRVSAVDGAVVNASAR